MKIQKIELNDLAKNKLTATLKCKYSTLKFLKHFEKTR